MSTAAIRSQCHRVQLLEPYAEHCGVQELSAGARVDRLTGAGRFLANYPDLAAWMRRPLPLRLADLDRCPPAWPLISFAVLTGRVQADFDLLAAKHGGRSFALAVAAIYPQEMRTLREAATRLGWADRWTATVLGHGLPLVVATTGCSPSALAQADIDQVRASVGSSPYYTPAARRARLSHMHSLGRLCYEAGVLPAPPIHRRGEGPGNLESRLAVVGARGVPHPGLPGPFQPVRAAA